MKKSGFVVGLIGAAFGLAVYNKMQKMTVNKDSVKGKSKRSCGKCRWQRKNASRRNIGSGCRCF